MSDIEIARATTALLIGESMTMPGLARLPAANSIHSDDPGQVRD